VPPPKGSIDGPVRALIFDSWYDSYRGAVCMVRVVDGTLRKGLDSVRVSMLTNAVFEGLMLRRAIAADFDPRPSISLYFAFLRAELAPALSTRKNTRGARK
jgi:hypothetical protein